MVKEISVEELLVSRLVRMNFLTGSVTIPREYGGYVIASGCGSGKTTAIKQLIGMKWHEGILYSASTINECDEMYNWVIENLFNKSVIGNKTLNEDDIIVIHSKSNDIHKDIFYNHPDDLTSKKILICTHAKLLNELPELLLRTSFIHKNELRKSHHERAVTSYSRGGSTLPRQWVLVDELPTYDSMRVSVKQTLLRLIGDRVEFDMPDGSIDIQYARPDYDKMLRYYDMSIKGDKSLALVKGDSDLSKLKTELLLDVVYERFYSYAGINDKEMIITNNISDYIIPSMETRILLFDGTGDLTFKGSPKWKLLEIEGTRYSSNISFEKFEFNISRRNIKLSGNISEELENLFDGVINSMIDQINNSEKILFVTWKNITLKEGFSYLKDQELNKLTFTKMEVNPDFLLPIYLKDKLIHRGCDPEKFDIIHYMSGLDKATNKYRDYDAISFIGNFQVPDSVVNEFNVTYSCCTDTMKFRLYQMVQAITRIRIRNHKCEDIKVYHSSDISPEVITELIKYFNGNCYNSITYIDPLLDHIRPKWREAVRELSKYDEGFKTAALSNSSYSMEISLDDIYKMVPLKYKEIRSYYPLINYLRKLGIELKVNSTWGSNQYK